MDVASSIGTTNVGNGPMLTRGEPRTKALARETYTILEYNCLYFILILTSGFVQNEPAIDRGIGTESGTKIRIENKTGTEIENGTKVENKCGDEIRMKSIEVEDGAEFEIEFGIGFSVKNVTGIERKIENRTGIRIKRGSDWD
ncbi:hypothetical protein EVAR_29465_1 [Eumeta japonica]|uniref:Uncharacterized protein n=1 Tax=Eumeta variegata TaxID=151549 RepID=A0A4C1WVZ7_EUMVA|nr:hypothetical protein EVAR_29465_1 [Eumeta japonica]